MTVNNFGILNYIEDEIYIYSKDGSIQFMNKSMISLIGENTLLKNHEQVTVFLRDAFKLIKTPEADLISSFENYEIHEASTNEYRSIKKNILEDGLTMITFKKRTQGHISSNQQNIENLLRENENKFRTFIKQLPQPIIITDDKGSIIQVNNYFLKIYGYDSEDVMNKNPNIVNPGKQVYFNLGYSESEYEELFSSMWRDILNPEIGWWEGTVLNRKKNNELIWVKLKINTIFDKDMKVRFHIGQPVDITAMVKNENLSKSDFYKLISAMAEVRDNETGRHMMRVGVFSKLIAKEIGQSEKFCKDIEIFAPMHDIGKVGIADSILLAPRTLTDEEFEIMKNHSIIGYNIIKGSSDFTLAKEIVLNHHEYWNGDGYPHQLKGDLIPLSARITTVVDVYDALRSKRPYKKSWTHQKALALIESQSGLRFDPFIVDTFIALSSNIENLYEQLT